MNSDENEEASSTEFGNGNDESNRPNLNEDLNGNSTEENVQEKIDGFMVVGETWNIIAIGI